MKRNLTEVEEKTVQKIADAIGWLDKLVFPGNPVKKITLVKGRPKNPRVYVYYIPSENTEDGVDHYQIYGYGLDEYIKKEMRTIRVILLLGTERIIWENQPEISEEELIISHAVHETRHRAQERLSIKLISPDSKDVEDIYVKAVIKFVKTMFNIKPPRGNYNLEFDAVVVEYIIREMWHRGERDIPKIVSIVKAGVREISPFDKA